MPRVNMAAVRAQTTLPTGYYDLLIANCERGYNNNGALRYRIEFRVHEPENMRGAPYFENIQVGTRPFDPGQNTQQSWIDYADLDDPDCLHEINHQNNPALRQLKRICEAAGIDCNRDVELDELMDEMNAGGLYIGARIVEAIQEGGGRYAGSPINRMPMIYARGREKARLEDEPASAQTPRSNNLRSVTPQMQAAQQQQRNLVSASGAPIGEQD